MPQKTKTNPEKQEMENERRELVHAREVICDRLARFISFLKNEPDNVFQIEIRLKSVEEDFCEYDRIQTRLEFLAKEECASRLDTESSFYMTIAEAKELIENIKYSKNQIIQSAAAPVNSAQLTSPNALGAVAKLPDLNLPTFYGSFETWFSFKDVFDSFVDRRQDLTDTEKFLYLKLSCKGDALKLIENLDVTASNYTTAIQSLQKRYENKKAVVNYHINKLLFSLPKVSGESSVDTRKLIDAVNQHILALRKLTLPVDQWDALLIPLILKRLDKKTTREWELKQSSNILPKLDELIEFLTKKCFALESLNIDHSKHTNNSKTYDKKPNYRSNQTQSFSSSPSFQSYLVTEKQRVFKCVMCGEFHFIYHCPEFLKLTVSERYEQIKKLKLCSNCLRSGHQKFEC